MTKLVALLTLLTLALGSAAGPASAAERKVPSREQWLKDVSKVMKGSGAYLRERTESGDTGLAVNFDIDNSSIASYYDGPQAGAIPRILKFATVAQGLGVALVFNTGRLNVQRQRTRTQLSDAGYDVAALCMRRKGETIRHGKQRCRNRFIAAGYTLIANVGNNPTDFTGDGYEKAYRLPNYGGELG
ncbi:HAD family acid phosphatase [Nocardioides dilutus]